MFVHSGAARTPVHCEALPQELEHSKVLAGAISQEKQLDLLVVSRRATARGVIALEMAKPDGFAACAAKTALAWFLTFNKAARIVRDRASTLCCG